MGTGMASNKIASLHYMLHCSAFLAALFLPLHHGDARHDAHVLHVQLFWSLVRGAVLLCSAAAAAGDGDV